MNNKIVEAGKEREDAFFITDKKEGKKLHRIPPNNFSKSTMLQRKATTPVSGLNVSKNNPLLKKHGISGSLNDKNAENADNKEEVDSLTMARDLLLDEFHRRQELRSKNKAVVKRTNEKFASLYRFRALNAKLAVQKSDKPSIEEKEKQDMALLQVHDDKLDDKEIPDVTTDRRMTEEETGNEMKVDKDNETEDKASSGRKTQIVQMHRGHTPSYSDYNSSQSKQVPRIKSEKEQYHEANKVLLLLQEKQKLRGSLQGIKDNGNMYNTLNRLAPVGNENNLEELIKDTQTHDTLYT